MFAAAEKAIENLARAVALIGGAGLLFAVLVTCASILGRLCRRLLHAALGNDFPLPAAVGAIFGEEELVQYAVGFALFTALPWLTLRQGHVTVDLLRDFFSEAVNRCLDLLGQLLFCGIVYLMMTRQWFLIFRKAPRGEEPLPLLLAGGDWAQAAARLRLSDESQILGIKLWPIYTVAELCVILLFIVSVFCVLRSMRAWARARRRHAA